MLIHLLKKANEMGWQLSTSLDVSSKYVSQENGPSYPLDVHSWFFSKNISTHPSSQNPAHPLMSHSVPSMNSPSDYNLASQYSSEYGQPTFHHNNPTPLQHQINITPDGVTPTFPPMGVDAPPYSPVAGSSLPQPHYSVLASEPTLGSQIRRPALQQQYEEEFDFSDLPPSYDEVMNSSLS